jgi:hypothetical protein
MGPRVEPEDDSVVHDVAKNTGIAITPLISPFPRTAEML